jgi:hypothetical protein
MNTDQNAMSTTMPAATMQIEIPEKFKDPETGELRLDQLLRSYKELERKLSVMMPRPENAESKMEIFKMLGMPDTPEAYEIDTSHGLFAADEDVNRKLFDNGMSIEQVQAVYDLAADKFVPMILELSQDFQADREIERLVSAFGGEEKWQEVSRQLLAYGQKNLPPEVLGSLSGSFEGVMALYRMMKGQSGDGQDFTMSDSPQAGVGEDGLSSMMRDPRYWRDRDPSYVAKVTKGFENMYGDK